MKLLKYSFLFSFLFIASHSFSQTDSLILNNGNVIIGEVKSLTKNVIAIETDYSDSDFKIEWNGIKEIYTERTFIIHLVGGNHVTGTISTASPTTLHIKGEEVDLIIDKSSIVYLDEFGNNFLSNFYATIELGVNLTKANNFKQFSVGATAGYLQENWSLDMNYSDLRSSQDDVEDIKRTSGGLEYRYLLPKNWFLSASASLLSNTEQSLELRTLGKLGTGYFPIKNNVLYWNFGAGLSINNEDYTPPLDSVNVLSYEAYIGTEINLFNVSDFSLISNVFVYPSLTQSGRVRLDYMINTKYELPLDFYVGLNFTLNYDNQPAEAGKEVDYVFGATFGWDW